MNTAEYLPGDNSANNSDVGDEIAYTLTIDNNGTLTLSSVTPVISEVTQRAMCIWGKPLFSITISQQPGGEPDKILPLPHCYVNTNQDAQLIVMPPCSSHLPGRRVFL